MSDLRLGDNLELRDTNSMKYQEETAIYLSCQCGSWDVTKALLEQGADPSILCTAAQLSCLHWLFAFDENEQAEVVCEFIKHGANINALSDEPISTYHFLFTLPRGTPFHWAVALQCHATIEA